MPAWDEPGWDSQNWYIENGRWKWSGTSGGQTYFEDAGPASPEEIAAHAPQQSWGNWGGVPQPPQPTQMPVLGTWGQQTVPVPQQAAPTGQTPLSQMPNPNPYQGIQPPPTGQYRPSGSPAPPTQATGTDWLPLGGWGLASWKPDPGTNDTGPALYVPYVQPGESFASFVDRMNGLIGSNKVASGQSGTLYKRLRKAYEESVGHQISPEEVYRAFVRRPDDTPWETMLANPGTGDGYRDTQAMRRDLVGDYLYGVEDANRYRASQAGGAAYTGSANAAPTAGNPGSGGPVKPGGGAGGTVPPGSQVVTTSGAGGQNGTGNPTAHEQAIIDAYREAAGFSREELAERVRQFNEELALKRDELERIGIPESRIQIQLQEMQAKQIESEIGLATQRLALDQEMSRGRLALDQEMGRGNLSLSQRAQGFTEELGRGNLALDQEIQRGRLGLDTEMGRGNLDLQRGNLGLDYLQTAAQLGGPADYFQSVDFNRGAQQRGDVPVFLNALANNTQLADYGATGAFNPDPVTAERLAGRLTGSGGGLLGAQSNTALDRIGGIFKAGAHGLGVGSLEQLDEAELQLLSSGGKKLGYDVPAFLEKYRKSRPMQTASTGSSLAY